MAIRLALKALACLEEHVLASPELHMQVVNVKPTR